MEAYLGMITAFGFDFAPRAWAQCAGQLVAIQSNAALFSLLGTTYGGNGVNTFGLPDLRGRTAIGQGAGPGLKQYTMGEISGTEQVTLNQTQMPQHTHTATANSTSTSTSTSTLNGENTPGTAALPNNHVLAGSGQNTSIYAAAGSGNVKALASESIVTNTTTTTATTVTVNPAGGNLPVSILQPFLCVNYCICTQGIYPSRN